MNVESGVKSSQQVTLPEVNCGVRSSIYKNRIN